MEPVDQLVGGLDAEVGALGSGHGPGLVEQARCTSATPGRLTTLMGRIVSAVMPLNITFKPSLRHVSVR